MHLFKRKYLFLFLLTYELGISQNLINNYSFEDSVQCPSSFGQLIYSQYWINPSNTTPDYFNTCINNSSFNMAPKLPLNCMGYQNAKTGNAYAGIILYKHNSSDSTYNYNEYIEANLNSPLINGHCYYFEMYYSLANSSGYGVNNLGVYFTTSQFTTSLGQYYNNISCPVTFDTTSFITDTLNWMKLSGNFFANGGENFITIGNFKDGTKTRAISLNNNFIGPCGPFVSDVCYVFIDDVILYDCTDVGIQNFENDHSISLYPNPANTDIYVNTGGHANVTLSIYNVMGQLMIQKAIVDRQAIDVKMLSSGTYIYRIYNEDNILKTGKLMISK